MRSFVEEKENPLLWASTYHAGECLDPVAVAEAKARRNAKKGSGVSSSSNIDYKKGPVVTSASCFFRFGINGVEGRGRGTEYGPCERFYKAGTKMTPRFRDGINIFRSRNDTLEPDLCDYGSSR